MLSLIMMTVTQEQKLASRFIPKGSTEIRHPLGVAYTQDTERAFFAIAYIGNAGKRCFYESYRRADLRDKRVSEFFSGLEKRAVLMAECRVQRAAPHSIKVGTILHHSWGWEQTNCDYYQVISVTAHTITVRAIGDSTVLGSSYSHGMADMRLAVADSFSGEPITLKASSAGISNKSGGALSHGSISVWDGKPNYCSWYA